IRNIELLLVSFVRVIKIIYVAKMKEERGRELGMGDIEVTSHRIGNVLLHVFCASADVSGVTDGVKGNMCCRGYGISVGFSNNIRERHQWRLTDRVRNLFELSGNMCQDSLSN